MRKIYAFCAEEDGAVTVDWVVLTAVVAGLGLIVLTQIGGPTTNIGLAISDYLDAVPVGSQSGD